MVVGCQQPLTRVSKDLPPEHILYIVKNASAYVDAQRPEDVDHVPVAGEVHALEYFASAI